jgi:hypothetical protein
MSNGFIYVVDAHFIDKIEENKYPGTKCLWLRKVVNRWLMSNFQLYWDKSKSLDCYYKVRLNRHIYLRTCIINAWVERHVYPYSKLCTIAKMSEWNDMSSCALFLSCPSGATYGQFFNEQILQQKCSSTQQEGSSSHLKWFALVVLGRLLGKWGIVHKGVYFTTKHVKRVHIRCRCTFYW